MGLGLGLAGQDKKDEAAGGDAARSFAHLYSMIEHMQLQCDPQPASTIGFLVAGNNQTTARTEINAWPESNQGKCQPRPIEIAQVSRSNVFICVLTREEGSSIDFT